MVVLDNANVTGCLWREVVGFVHVAVRYGLNVMKI